MKNRDKLTTWVNALTKKQMKLLLVDLISFAMDSEEVRFGDLAPYWESNGEPLVEGQQTWEDD